MGFENWFIQKKKKSSSVDNCLADIIKIDILKIDVQYLLSI